MAIHIHPLDIPPRYYKPIGQIVAGWNLTEQYMQSVIWHFHKIKSPKVGRLFTYRPTAIQKLHMLRVTADKHVQDQVTRQELLALCSAADKVRKARNKFAHGFWGRMPKQRKTWKVFYAKDPADTYLLKRDVIDLQDLKTTADQVRQLNADLRRFMQKHGVPPP